MKQDTVADRVWCVALIALPALAVLLGSIPGFLLMYDGQTKGVVGCTLWNPPVRNIMSNLCPLLLVLFGYTLVLAVCYYRSQALGTVRALFVFSVVCLVVSTLALLLDHTVMLMPYVLIPGTWVVMSVVCFIRMTLEAKRFEFD